MDQPLLFPPEVDHDPGGRAKRKLPADTLVATEFSACRVYRYKLLQRWAAGPLCMWLMMNPSTADEHTTDPTVAKCAAIARLNGYGGQYIANVCAARFTDKTRLLGLADPVGPRNLAAILEMASEAHRVIAAYGHLPGDLPRVARETVEAVLAAGHAISVLGLSQDGTPTHPLARGKWHIPITKELLTWRTPL